MNILNRFIVFLALVGMLAILYVKTVGIETLKLTETQIKIADNLFSLDMLIIMFAIFIFGCIMIALTPRKGD